MMKYTTSHARHCLVSFIYRSTPLYVLDCANISISAGRLCWWCAVPRQRDSGQPFSRCSSQAQNCLEIPVLSKDALLLSYYGAPADVLGKLGPSLIWRQIGPAIFLGCDKLGPKITVTERRKTLPLHCWYKYIFREKKYISYIIYIYPPIFGRMHPIRIK